MNHHFDVDHAEKYGLEAAIIINHLQYWLRKNKANGAHFYDGRTWTYNSVSAYAELFPYMKPSVVRRAFERLVKMGVLLAGNYNESPWNRTKWYAFNDESSIQNSQMHLSENAVPFAKSDKSTFVKSDKSLTDIIPSIIPDIIPKPPKSSDTKTEKTKKQRPAPSEDGVDFANWFKATLPEKNALAANWQTAWARTYDDMTRLDSRSKEAIYRVCSSARSDAFWSKNFLSPVKLRNRDKNGVQYFDIFSALKSTAPMPILATSSGAKLKSRGECIGDASQEYLTLTMEQRAKWPKRDDGRDQTPDEVGHQRYCEQ